MSDNVKIAGMMMVMMAVGTLVVLNRGGSSPCCPSRFFFRDNDAPLTAGVYNNPSGLPRLVELGSTTCVACQMMKPVIEELAAEYAGKLDVIFINVMTDIDEAGKYNIEVIPTQVFVDASGNELFRHVGVISKEDILAKWSELGFNFMNMSTLSQESKTGG